MKAFKLGLWAVLTMVLLAMLVSLIHQNGEPLTVSLFSYTSQDYPKWAVLIACLLLGALLASLFFIVELIILETQNIRLRRSNKKLERALSQYNPQVPLPGSSREPTLPPTLEEDI